MRRAELVVVGAGPAGCAAAVQCRRLGVTPLLLDEMGIAGGLLANAHRIENYPGLVPMDGPAFVERLAAHLVRFRLEIERGRVRALRPLAEGLLIETDCGEIASGAVILAVGTHPRALDLPGDEQARIFHEVRPLLVAHPEPRRILVIGGGEAACDYALSLAAAGAQVRILVRGSRLRARGRLAQRIAEQEQIVISYGAVAQEIHSGIVLALADGSRTEEAEALLVAIGRRSAAPPLLPEGPAAGIFVVGDARSGALGQAGIAIGDGLAAAAAAVDLLDKRGPGAV